MKIKIDDLSGLPEGLKSVVETEGDKSTLDLSKLMIAEDLAGLKSALQKERGNASAYAKYGTPEEIEAKIADLTEKAKGSGKGAEDAQAKLDAMAADYDGKLSAKDAKIDALMRSTAGASLKAELAKAGFIAEAIDMMAISAMGRLEFNEDGSPKVLTSDGKPMIGNGADHGATLADLAKELAEANPFAVRDGGKGGGGKQPGNSGGTPEKKWGEMTSGEKVRLHRENPKEYERIKAAG
ncbi:hypothetical protein NBRC116598_21280 [Pseudophaeobacter arcticus]|uniref:Phage minor structural protein GP20 n=1 Tax=Pseudophaeobacter arcticus TaxID=385492 RepID=A0ABQ0ALF0_9RHOB